MDNKEKLNKPENNEEFIIPEFEDYQSKKKPDVDEVIKKLNERITALEAEENTLEEIKEILEKHNLKYLCDPDLNAVEIMFDERPFRVQIILNEYRLELKLIFPFAAQRASLAMIALFMINFNKDKAFACMHLNPDNGEMSMKYSYFISKTAGLDVDDFWVYMTSIIIVSICREFNINEEWLRTGNGEMMSPVSKDEEISKLLGEVIRTNESDFRRRLISALARLDDKGWNELEKLIDLISENK